MCKECLFVQGSNSNYGGRGLPIAQLDASAEVRYGCPSHRWISNGEDEREPSLCLLQAHQVHILHATQAHPPLTGC